MDRGFEARAQGSIISAQSRPAARRKIRRDPSTREAGSTAAAHSCSGSGRGSGGTVDSPRMVPGIPNLFDGGFRQPQRHANQVTKFVALAVRVLSAGMPGVQRQAGQTRSQDQDSRRSGHVHFRLCSCRGINLSPNKPPGNLFPHCFCSDGHVKAAMGSW